jgi:hypothetical protein
VLDVSLGNIKNFELPRCNRTEWNDTVYVQFGDNIPEAWAVDYSWPDLDFEFDEKGLNMTLEAKNAGTISNYYNEGSKRFMYQGDTRITFRGVIDSWHSDVLLINSSKPAWRQTVGYDEEYFAYGAFKSLSCRLSSSNISTLFTMAISFIMGFS